MKSFFKARMLIIIVLLIFLLGCSGTRSPYSVVCNNQLFCNTDRWCELTVVSKDNNGRELFCWDFSVYYVYMICRVISDENSVAVYDMDCYIMSDKELDPNSETLQKLKIINDWDNEINAQKEVKYSLEESYDYWLSDKMSGVVWNMIGFEYDNFTYESIVTPNGNVIFLITPAKVVGEYPGTPIQGPSIMVVFNEKSEIINKMELEGEYVEWKEQIREFKKAVDEEQGVETEDGSVSPN